MKDIIKIREAGIYDIKKITGLFKETIQNINSNDYNDIQISVWIEGGSDPEKWKKKINEQYFYAAEKNEIIVGFGSITDKGYLDYLYVHKDYQRQSIASLLYEKLEQKAKELRLNEISAHVSITARPFFAAKGFKIIKIYTTISKNVEFEDCVMKKKLE